MRDLALTTHTHLFNLVETQFSALHHHKHTIFKFYRKYPLKTGTMSFVLRRASLKATTTTTASLQMFDKLATREPLHRKSTINPPMLRGSD